MKSILSILLLFISISLQAQLCCAYTAPPPFDPGTLGTLKLWLKADDLVLSDNDPVSTWTDNSSASNTMTGSSSTRPLYKTNIQNSLPIVRFDGSDDFLSKSSPSGIGGVSALSISLVVKQATLAINKTYLSNWNYGVETGWAWQTDVSATDEMLGLIALSGGDGGTNYQQSSNANLTTNFFIITMVYDGSQTNSNRVKFYKNGVLSTGSTTGTIATSLQSNSQALTIGTFQGLGRYFNGDFGEIVMWVSADGTERANVESYLATKWNIH